MDEKRLYDAAVKGDVKSLVDLLKEDPLILDRVSFTCSKKTPLHIATICQHTAFVREIVQWNPLLAAELDSYQSSSLHIASAKGYTEIVKALVSAAPDMCLARDCQGRNPLHLAAINGHVTVFNELMTTTTLVSAAPDMFLARDCQGRNPLHLAAINGHVTVFNELMTMTTLVSAAPDMFLARDCQGRNPLHLAAINGLVTVFNELMMTTTCSVAVREKVDRGQTVLHLCVKHKQLQVMENITRVINDDEFVNAKNDDGDTILHLAVRDKNSEAVRHLMGITGIDVNAINANGYSALNILELTPTDLRDANYLHIKNCLQPFAYNFNKLPCEKRDSMMVVAILFATIAFQAGMTPPGGVWQDNATDSSHQAGEAVMAHFHPKYYKIFIFANTIAFISSLSMILLLISGFPFRRFMCSLMVIMWLTVISTSVIYGASIRVVTPKKDRKTTIYAIDCWLIVWYSVLVIPFVWNTVDRLLQKRGITMWRPRRFIDLVGMLNKMFD